VSGEGERYSNSLYALVMFQGRTVYIWGECWELHFLFLGAQQSEFIILGTFLWLWILSGCWLCTPDQPSHSVPSRIYDFGTCLWLCIFPGCWLCTPDHPSLSVPQTEFRILGDLPMAVYFVRLLDTKGIHHPLHVWYTRNVYPCRECYKWCPFLYEFWMQRQFNF